MENRIKELRICLGLTQQQLADLVDVRRETILLLEKNKYNPSLKLAYKITKVLGVSIEELFVFDDLSHT